VKPVKVSILTPEIEVRGLGVKLPGFNLKALEIRVWNSYKAWSKPRLGRLRKVISLHISGA